MLKQNCQNESDIPLISSFTPISQELLLEQAKSSRLVGVNDGMRLFGTLALKFFRII